MGPAECLSIMSICEAYKSRGCAPPPFSNLCVYEKMSQKMHEPFYLYFFPKLWGYQIISRVCGLETGGIDSRPFLLCVHVDEDIQQTSFLMLLGIMYVCVSTQMVCSLLAMSGMLMDDCLPCLAYFLIWLYMFVTPFPRWLFPALFCSFRHLACISSLLGLSQPLMLVHSAIPLNDNVFLPFIR